MSLFEYLSVAVSIVLSLAVVRLISAFPHASSAPRRYWVHLGYVLLLGAQSLLVWWNNWAYRDVTDWVLPGFLLVLLMPITLYFMASTLVPDDPAEVVSWRAHFYAVHRRFFLSYIFLFGLFSLSSGFLLGLPVLHPQRLVHVAGVGLCVLAALTDDERVHQILLSVVFLVFVSAIAVFFVTPGGISPS